MSIKRRYISYASAITIVGAVTYYLIYGNVSSLSGVGKNELLVVSVPDGDTIKVRYGSDVEYVRLIGIDAPESGQGKWGEISRERLYSLAPPGSTVILEFDVTVRDKYNRLLGYLFTKDGRFINEILLKEGLAMLYTFPPNVKYVDKLRSAQSYARKNGLGIWGEDGLLMSPQDFRRQKKK